MANPDNTVLYIGVTNDINRRVMEHKNLEGSVFATEYNCVVLVYLEEYQDIKSAIAREKNLKNWTRAWKEDLINSVNPERSDLSENW